MIRLAPEEVELAVILLLRAQLSTAYGVKVDVQGLTSKDFDENGALVLRSPAVRVQLSTGTYEAKRDNQKLTYQGSLMLGVCCYDESLQSKTVERNKIAKLVGCVQNILTGARLALEGGERTEPVELNSFGPAIDPFGVVDNAKSVQFTVSGFAQFAGPNANFGGGN